MIRKKKPIQNTILLAACIREYSTMFLPAEGGGEVSKEHRALGTVPILETEFRRPHNKTIGSPWKRANVNISNRTRATWNARGLIQRLIPTFCNLPPPSTRMKTCKQCPLSLSP